MSQPVPLVIALHGYGYSGQSFTAFTGYDRLARREGFVLLAPDGTPDRRGSRYWNASPACCNFFGGTVDDVAYLKRLIGDARARYRIDPSRIYLIGISNGGFMSHRLACEDSSEIAALISIAGAADIEGRRCAPAAPVSVLQIHGDADTIVRYQGGINILGLGGMAYPGVLAGLKRWATHNRCTGELQPAHVALGRGLFGAETNSRRVSGCPTGADVELWTIRGGEHVPNLSQTFVDRSWAWLKAHPKVQRPGPR